MIHYTRELDGRWLRADVKDLNAALNLTAIDCTLLMRDVYEEVKFS